ncbi:hypothetical protein JCM6294_1107 [Bacteroides pyogenes DSM 20611 = JCM 6294]|uniref:Uncharacterized protein n=1 Tax=Bacteroides pyogenes DSM 20611 = JCM 6294 TaxID=1121100 RepID=W4PEJ9_9BACE|nr:hypothetical protein JCM6294_1107 [Bacteroides pyogenes DSM 20611 = JCM 6294]
MKKEIQERNPFSSLVSSIKDYIKAEDEASKKTALTNVFKSASGAIDLVGGAIDAVTSGMEKMGIRMDEETQAIMNDIGGILDGASNLQVVSRQAIHYLLFKAQSVCYHPRLTCSIRETEKQKSRLESTKKQFQNLKRHTRNFLGLLTRRWVVTFIKTKRRQSAICNNSKSV